MYLTTATCFNPKGFMIGEEIDHICGWEEEQIKRRFVTTDGQH